MLREYVAALNWFRLLTGRLDEASIPGLVAGLLGPRGIGGNADGRPEGARR